MCVFCGWDRSTNGKAFTYRVLIQGLGYDPKNESPNKILNLIRVNATFEHI